MKKQKKVDTLYCRATERVRKDVEKLASLKRRTMSEIVLFAVEQYIEREMAVLELQKAIEGAK